MTVYIEIIFFDNFLLDTLLLWLVARFSPRRPLRRIILVGALGGIYAVLASVFSILASFPSKMIAGCLLILICFPRSFLHSLLYFYVFSALLGGVIFAGFPSSMNTQGTVSDRFRILLIGCTAAAILTDLLSRTGFTPAQSITVESVFGNESLIFSAEYDSGCLVRDPRGNAVILIDRVFFNKNLPSPAHIGSCPTKTFRISTASGDIVLKGFKPDRIILSDGKHRYRADTWIVIAEQISLNGSPAIFGKGLITESEEIKCRHFSESAFSGFSHCFTKTAAIISAAANHFRRHFPKKRNPPSC